MFLRIFPLILAAVILPGCASTISAYKNRATSKHGLFNENKYEQGQIFIMSGERRVAVAFPKKFKVQFLRGSVAGRGGGIRSGNKFHRIVQR
ncbi:hypothetical protein BV96_04701 [Sphingomonas paucimobilis]|nr:hypothetical protein BV96_04701 [Sphingomonas paucimobilis]